MRSDKTSTRHYRSGPSATGTSRISQVVTLVAVVVPPLGLALGDGPALGRRASTGSTSSCFVGLYVVCAFGTTIGFHRYFTHRGFEARAAGQGDARDPRLHDDAGPGHAVGDRPPQAPRALRQARRPALAARRPRRRRLAARCAASCTRTSAGCSRTSAWSRAASTAGPLRGPARPHDRPAVPALGRADARHPVRDRLRASAARGRRGVEGLVWGGLIRIFLVPARDLQRELDLPHVRAAGLPLARRGAQQLARRAARLRRGLAQQPPRVPGLGAARPRRGGRSTSRGG